MATCINEKLIALNRCLETIQETLSIVNSGSISADDLLPLTIWVVLRSCPKRFISNIKFDI